MVCSKERIHEAVNMAKNNKTMYHQRISLQNPNALIIPNTGTGNEPKTNRLEGFLDHSTSWIDQPVR